MELYVSIAAFVISAMSFVLSAVTYVAGLHREQKQATLDAFNIMQNQVFDELNHFRKTDIARIAEDTRSAEYQEISGLLARCAHFSVGVNSGIYDYKTVRRLAGRYIIGLYDKLEPLIEKKRKLNQVERHYLEFEIFAKRLKKDYCKNRAWKKERAELPAKM